jgi:hypothetical protein
MRSWAWDVIKISLDHQTTHDSPARPSNDICDNALNDEEQHVRMSEKDGKFVTRQEITE